MKWIVVAIVVFVIGYTIVNIYYRKPGRAYRPYQDAQDRATTVRLLAAGWQKVHVESRRPVEKPSVAAPAAITRGAVGLGPDLAPQFAEAPKLLKSIDKVVASSAVAHGADYTVYFTATLANQKSQVGDVSLYRKASELVLVPTIEPLPGKDLMSRWSDANYCISFSTESLAPGRYTMRIVAQGPAAAWSFTVK